MVDESRAFAGMADALFIIFCREKRDGIGWLLCQEKWRVVQKFFPYVLIFTKNPLDKQGL